MRRPIIAGLFLGVVIGAVFLAGLSPGVAWALSTVKKEFHHTFTAGLTSSGATIISGAATLSGGTTLGASGTAISDSYAASSSINFAGVTDACEDSAGITVTGAAVNDVCAVGPPATMAHANAWVTCYVSGANEVKVRLCAHGASGDPAAGTYTVRVFDP